MKKKARRKILKLGERIAVMAVVTIAIGAAVMASEKYLNKNKNSAPSDGCPEGMSFVGNEKGGFCIDKYENSAGSNCPATDPANQSDTVNNLNTIDCRPVSEPGRLPWRNISQIQAAAACARAGKRLPSDEEWYQAALGTPDKNAAWTTDDCNVSRNWPANPGLTGSAKNCVSGAGAYDMVGNIWEWVKSEAVDGMYKGKKLPEEGYVGSVDISGMPLETTVDNRDSSLNNDYFWIKNKDTRAMARGGYWDNGDEAGQYSIYLVLPPSATGSGVGFRCIK